MSTKRYFRLATKSALRGDSLDASRQYRLGAAGIRRDGVIVTASNIPNRTPHPRAHAEARLLRKLDWGSTVYVVRVQRNGRLTMARPCRKCEVAMRQRGVRRCYYSISDREWGVFRP